MDELRQKIYDHFTHSPEYRYSSEPSEKLLELKAIEALESEGYIVIRTRSIGYVVADVV
jgi:hypothetical protein